jgi:hypothetical protein
MYYINKILFIIVLWLQGPLKINSEYNGTVPLPKECKFYGKRAFIVENIEGTQVIYQVNIPRNPTPLYTGVYCKKGSKMVMVLAY